LDTAESFSGRETRLAWSEAPCGVVIGELIEVCPYFLGQPVVAAPPQDDVGGA
jgi:hypothetical protein